MTIELIDLDTGATMEVHGDKTSGLQFEGKPTERALRAGKVKILLEAYLDGECELFDEQWETILEALELMAQEKINEQG